MIITILVLTASKGSSTFEFYFGEYFQFIRILVKHCGLNRKNTNKEDCRAKSESEQINQDCRAESESEQNFGPLSTTPPSPRAPPAGLFTSSPAPHVEGTVKRGTSILVTHKNVRQIPDQVSHLGPQLEENWNK